MIRDHPPGVNGSGRIPSTPPKSNKPPPFPFTPLDRFMAKNCQPEWLLPGLLVRGQPGLIAGPSKALKTGVSIDLSVSAAAGVSPLGYFDKPEKPVRVAMVSGESGEPTVQETIRRIMRARGVTAEQIGDRLQLCFNVPQLTDERSMVAFTDAVAGTKAELIFLDPAYLMMNGVDPKSMFEMGAVLLAVAARLLALGCTPILLHHANRTLKTGEPMELTHLAYSGLEQFARQFILINRMSPYQGDGRHDLNVGVGGSVGHGGRYSVQISEGVTGADFTGRTWDVKVTPAVTVIAEKKAGKKLEKARTQLEEEAKLMRAVDELIAEGNAVATRNRIREKTGYSDDRAIRVIASLQEQTLLRMLKDVEMVVGQGGKRKCDGYVRVPGEHPSA